MPNDAPLELTLGRLSADLGGEGWGDPETVIRGAASIRSATADDITLIDDARYLPHLSQCAAAAVVCSTSIDRSSIDIPGICVADVQEAFASIVRRFRPPRSGPAPGISPAAHVAASARVAATCVIYPGVYVGDDVEIAADAILHPGVQVMAGSRVGAATVLYPNVVLYENTRVGPRCTIHAGAILGSYGFGYQTRDGRHTISPQLGYVEIHADVEIGAGTTIDRGTYDVTVVGEGTKIDNQVMIAHNCHIGRHNIICSQVGIAGSCTTGDYVVMAGQVGLCDHVSVGDRSVLGAKAGVMNDVPSDNVFIGLPAMKERDYWRRWVSSGKVPELQRQLKSLVRTVESLKSSGDPTVKTDAA